MTTRRWSRYIRQDSSGDESDSATLSLSSVPSPGSVASLADSIIDDHAPQDLHTDDVSPRSSTSDPAEFVNAGSRLHTVDVSSGSSSSATAGFVGAGSRIEGSSVSNVDDKIQVANLSVAPLADSIIEDHAPHDLHTVDVSSRSSIRRFFKFIKLGYGGVCGRRFSH
eukprot:TRINITY_DN1541_c0_g1_i17.p1 TRINITY_DN1541_c0_g1~~TRINITY_DN1541_c0_g1_i17.p1  ORF type:complete len:167 (-),score=18.99 TRINITY_DN1541_c0_g1_i17:270-770(-)